MYFRLGGGTLKGISKPGEIVWSRIFIDDTAGLAIMAVVFFLFAKDDPQLVERPLFMESRRPSQPAPPKQDGRWSRAILLS